MKKLEIYKTLTEMNFDNDDVKRETLNNRINWVMGLIDCDYQSAYKAVKAVRMGEDMENYIFCEEVKKARKNLKGVRSWWNRYAKNQYKTSLTEQCLEFLSDTLIIARNLGFDINFELPTKYEDVAFSDWNNFDIYTTDKKLFANVKLYKNGNRHIKFCKEFMQKLNVEMARINNWVQDKSEAMAEMDIPAGVIASVWGSNLQIGISDGRKLLGLPEK